METPIQTERTAGPQPEQEKPAEGLCERDKNELVFHINRMLKITPINEEWAGIQSLLLELAKKIQEKCHE